MRRLLFVITSNANMGDLALCQEWIGDLGREDCRFGYVLTRDMAKFVDERDVTFLFESDVDVRDTILNAAADFQPDAIVVACNSFWNIPNQKGADFGVFPLRKGDTEIPVLSFDPFEIGFEMRLPLGGDPIRFESVPDWVWALRYMSRTPTSPNARHFRARRIFSSARGESRADIVVRSGGNPAKRTVFFPVSRNRHEYISEHYGGYYDHLAELFSLPACNEAQFFVLSPEPTAAFQNLPNVVQLPLVKYEEFLALIHAADLYLTDSLISCIVDAFHLETPSLLLANSQKSFGLHENTFLEAHFFPYRIFPYGMADVCQTLEERFEINGCFEVAEVLDADDFSAKITGLLSEGNGRETVVSRCRAWKEARERLPSPHETIESILASPVV